jgi:hypothetical protein
MYLIPFDMSTLPVAPLPENQSLLLAKRPSLAPLESFLRCTVNHFSLSITARVVFQFQVTITPETLREKHRHLLLEQHRDVLGSHYLFDGHSLMFTNSPMEDLTLDCYSTSTQDLDSLGIHPHTPILQFPRCCSHAKIYD